MTCELLKIAQHTAPTRGRGLFLKGRGGGLCFVRQLKAFVLLGLCVHAYRLEELSARQEELMTAISETRNGAPDSAATFSAGSTLPLSTRVEATAVYQPFVEEMIANMGYMKPETWRRAIKECVASTAPPGGWVYADSLRPA